MDWILEWRHEALTPLFLALTFLGETTFFMIFMPLGYWLYRRDVFFRLSVVLFVSAFLNSILKEIFQVPRPETVQLVEAGGWSFPSGHAQIAATLWPWLALELRALKPRVRWISGVVALLVAGVAASRVYLGVHRPVDVVVGVAVGLTLVASGRLLVRSPWSWWEGLGPLGQSFAVAAGVTLGLAVMVVAGELDSVSVVVAGALLGFWVGAQLQSRQFDLTPPRGVARALVVVVIGLLGAFGLRMGLKMSFNAADVDWRLPDFVRYAAVGAWLSYLGPWTFHRLRLLGSE